MPPRSYPTKGEIPALDRKGCTVTIVSSSQFNTFTSVDVAVGQNVVAKLGRNEYMKFQLPEGLHWLRLVWRKWGFDAITIGELHLSLPQVHSKAAMADCNNGGSFIYGASFNSNANDSEDKFDLKQITELNEDFKLVGKTLVPVKVNK